MQNGTTYNSFIIKGADKARARDSRAPLLRTWPQLNRCELSAQIALIDSSHEKFRDLYMKALRKEVDLSKLDYIVVRWEPFWTLCEPAERILALLEREAPSAGFRVAAVPCAQA